MKLTKKITMLIATFGVLGLAGSISVLPAYAADCSGIECVGKGADNAKTGGANTSDLPKVIKLITDLLLFILGAVSVIMIVVGGIKYTTSNGNPEQIKSAKNTVMYSIVGLIVAIFAYAIVHFVIDKLT